MIPSPEIAAEKKYPSRNTTRKLDLSLPARCTRTWGQAVIGSAHSGTGNLKRLAVRLLTGLGPNFPKTVSMISLRPERLSLFPANSSKSTVAKSCGKSRYRHAEVAKFPVTEDA
jgi:hypothetical protein